MWNANQIKSLLATNDRAVVRGIVVLYDRQTADEKASDATRHHNGIGFNALDAGILSSFARQIRSGKTLSEKQMAVAKKCMMKYAGQLASIANEREAVAA